MFLAFFISNLKQFLSGCRKCVLARMPIIIIGTILSDEGLVIWATFSSCTTSVHAAEGRHGI